jgi:hypothetical protein
MLGRNVPPAYAATTAPDAVTVGTPTAVGAKPPCCARGYASPLRGMTYNERPHEWLLSDPDDKDAVEHVRVLLL